jgi:hypothetical protein
MLGVGSDGSRRIEPAHVAWLVGPDGSRRIQTDRLDVIIGMIKRIRQKAGWQGKSPGAIAVGEVGQASA